MLKTNSKKARENLQKYITEGFDGSNYGINAPENFSELAKIVLETFYAEKRYEDYQGSIQDLFEDWCAGLPSIIDTCYYYNRSAVDDLAVILEETEAEKAKYTESKAEKMLSYLIYRELTKEASK